MTDTATNAQLFAEAGRTLYGDHWQSPMARLLGINLRSVQYIAAAAEAGESYRIAPGVMTEIVDHLKERGRACQDLQSRIARFHAA